MCDDGESVGKALTLYCRTRAPTVSLFLYLKCTTSKCMTQWITGAYCIWLAESWIMKQGPFANSSTYSARWLLHRLITLLTSFARFYILHWWNCILGLLKIWLLLFVSFIRNVMWYCRMFAMNKLWRVYTMKYYFIFINSILYEKPQEFRC